MKPTIAPLAEIPPLKKKKEEPDLIDLGEPRKETPAQKPTNGDVNGSKIALRTEEEQQAASRAREERDRRDARRKSLANRRVSFAAEATLHTFHDVEYMQDSTTSTDATRRNSAITGPQTGRESTPQEQIQGAPESPDNQRDLHQRKRRRSSGLPATSLNNSEDDTIASNIYSSDSEPADAVEEIAEIEDDGSDSDSDDGTMMSIVTEEVTGTTIASDRSVDSTQDNSTLDEVLRLAAQRAGTQRLDENESDDGLDDGEEFIPSFGWANAGKKQSAPANAENHSAKDASSSANQPDDDGTEMEMDMDVDMEMTRAVGGIIKPQSTQQTEPEEEMSMDVTRAFGGILSQKSQEHDESAIEDDEDDVPMEEATMEFTTAVGGIRHPVAEDTEELEEGEDMSMELTTVIGGVLNQKTRKSIGAARRRTITRKQNSKDDDATMDMTVGLGRIISGPQAEHDEDEDDADGDATMGMDMTTAIGGILGNATADSRMLGKRIMEEEVDVPDDPDKAIMAAVHQTAVDASHETVSPGLSAFHGMALRRSVGPQVSASGAASISRTPSPIKGSTTPKSTPRSLFATKASVSTTPQSSAKQKAPTSTTPSTPKLKSKSPKKDTLQSSVRKLRSASKAQTVTPSPAKSPQKKSSLFHENPKTGSRTPTVVLTPQSRRLSGVGADRAGLGSPRIAALFDRRTSIGDAAVQFVPGRRTVAFEDPKELQEEVDKDRQEEEDKENRRKILEREADGSQDDKEATLNLREMIDSLSPKRNPLRGRKSLHVGSARGLLGKRQFESDDEEEAEDKDGVDRLKGHQSSPVKKVKLQQPPSKEETTGRLTRSLRLSLPSNANSATPTLSSPQKDSLATTPKNQGRFKDVEDDRAAHAVNFNDSPVKDASELEEEVDGDRIHLQDFLNMTSIRFMELTTTKRRHTQAPESFKNGDSAEGQGGMSLERCVVAGACTVPMLELYQHSCRELKKYISEGRRMVKEIEMDTFEENPPLFREYMSASPEVKSLMDNQFKNVKAHARLLSKAMWYEWRMKLQDGIKEGLVKIAEGMEGDEECLNKQQELLTSVMPDVLTRHEALVEESQNLEQVARELADCDPAELDTARDELASLNQDIEQKKKLIAELRQQFQGSQDNVETLTMQKQQCLEEIKEAEKVREECRGWTSTEVNSLKGKSFHIIVWNFH